MERDLNGDGTNYDTWLNDCLGHLKSVNTLANEQFGIGSYERWDMSQDTGLFTFSNTGKVMASIPIGFKHDVETQVSMLLRLPRPRERRDIQNIIHSLFDQEARAGIKALSQLAPKAPAPGQPFQRNTEYPYQDNAGRWRVPADAGSFTLPECDRFKRLAYRISEGVARIMSAVERANP